MTTDPAVPIRPNVQIGPMRKGEIPQVASIEAAARLLEDDLRAELARPWSRIWVAREAADEVVAFLLVWLVVDEVHVLNLATRADRRRRGIARMLMDEALDHARRNGATQLLLEVRRSNRAAIALYRSLGFYVSGVRAHYYADDEDAVEMVLRLDRDTGSAVPHTDDVSLGG